jgi:hypothetical protein
MGITFPICLAEFMAIKGLAAIAVLLVVYLYCLSLREKHAQRKLRREAERRRREHAANLQKK